jgi:hypothetical protein
MQKTRPSAAEQRVQRAPKGMRAGPTSPMREYRPQAYNSRRFGTLKGAMSEIKQQLRYIS